MQMYYYETTAKGEMLVDESFLKPDTVVSRP